MLDPIADKDMGAKRPRSLAWGQPIALSPALPSASHFLSEHWATAGVGCDKGDETPKCSVKVGSC